MVLAGNSYSSFCNCNSFKSVFLSSSKWLTGNTIYFISCFDFVFRRDLYIGEKQNSINNCLFNLARAQSLYSTWRIYSPCNDFNDFCAPPLKVLDQKNCQEAIGLSLHYFTIANCALINSYL